MKLLSVTKFSSLLEIPKLILKDKNKHIISFRLKKLKMNNFYETALAKMTGKTIDNIWVKNKKEVKTYNRQHLSEE